MCLLRCKAMHGFACVHTHPSPCAPVRDTCAQASNLILCTYGTICFTTCMISIYGDCAPVADYVFLTCAIAGAQSASDAQKLKDTLGRKLQAVIDSLLDAPGRVKGLGLGVLGGINSLLDAPG